MDQMCQKVRTNELRNMELTDGLKKYKSYSADYAFTVQLESEARGILDLLDKYGDQPSQSALAQVKSFLLKVEKWKAGCLQQRTGNAVKNKENSIWYAFQGAVSAATDTEAILSIMKLKGFGSSVDDVTGQRRAKVATSVLRFLWPDTWGVVDWRVAVILGMLGTHNWNVDRVFFEANKNKAEDLRDLYNFMNEQAACEMNMDYREISQRYSNILPRAADVDMALFGLSLMVWPMP